MLRRDLPQVIGFVLLVAMGVCLRVALQNLPNFAPVAALALFAGFWLRNRWLAIAVPLSVMGISDLFIGGYAWQMMLLVYVMLALPVFCGGPLRRCIERRGVGQQVALLSGCSLASSLAFFAITNGGAWLWFDTYPHSVAGLWQCYLAALPFFRFTLAGDLFFATLLFGSYVVASQLAAPAAAVADN